MIGREKNEQESVEGFPGSYIAMELLQKRNMPKDF